MRYEFPELFASFSRVGKLHDVDEAG